MAVKIKDSVRLLPRLLSHERRYSIDKNKPLLKKPGLNEFSQVNNNHIVAKAPISTSDFMLQAKSTPTLDKHVAIVTGGAEGIGLAISSILLKYGIGGLTIADICGDKSKEAVNKLICDYGAEKVLYIEADVSQSNAFHRVFKETTNTFENVSVVINNAGVMNDVDWEGQLHTNLTSTVLGTLLGLHYMSKTSFGQGGHIINVSSIMGLIPSAGYPIHTLTQFGIVGFSRAIGAPTHFERTGVKVTSLCPGLTNTKLLKQAPYHAITDRFRKEFKDESSGCVYQKPESVALGVLDLLCDSLPGSVWVVENNSRAYEIKFPEVADMRFKNKC